MSDKATLLPVATDEIPWLDVTLASRCSLIGEPCVFMSCIMFARMQCLLRTADVKFMRALLDSPRGNCIEVGGWGEWNSGYVGAWVGG